VFEGAQAGLAVGARIFHHGVYLAADLRPSHPISLLEKNKKASWMSWPAKRSELQGCPRKSEPLPERGAKINAEGYVRARRGSPWERSAKPRTREYLIIHLWERGCSVSAKRAECVSARGDSSDHVLPWFLLGTPLHGCLDALSRYSFGVEFFAPLSVQRFRFPWTPLGDPSGLAGQLIQEAFVFFSQQC